MDEIVEIRTEPGGKEFIKFNRFHLFRKTWYIAYAPVLLFAVIGTVGYFDDDLAMAIIFWSLAPLMPLLMLGLTSLSAKKHLKTNQMYVNMKNVYYRFDRSSLFSETVSPKLKTTLETDWDNVYRVYETSDSFYIYISNMQAFILPKADIVTGTAEGLSQLIQEIVGKKYYKKR